MNGVIQLNSHQLVPTEFFSYGINDHFFDCYPTDVHLRKQVQYKFTIDGTFIDYYPTDAVLPYIR